MKTWEQFLEQQQSNIAYFIPTGEVQIGGYVRPSDRTNLGGGRQEIEKLFEEGRLQHNPSAPSRLNAIYLCPSLESCKWTRKGSTTVYEVQIESGNPFITDAEIFTEAVQRYDRNKEEDVSHWIEDYWTINPNEIYSHTPEMLLHSTAKVRIVKKVKEVNNSWY